MQRERDKAEAAGLAKDAEQEQQALIVQAKAKVEADAKAKMEELSLAGSKAGEKRNFEIALGVKIIMCWIPPGEFLMGSPVGVSQWGNDETQHRVTLTQGFWLAKTETTQAQWQAVMGNNPSHFKGKNLPVETVSWNDIAGSGGFIGKVNQTAAAGGRFALPTEAQWEYACQVGTKGAYDGELAELAWFDGNGGKRAHPVTGKMVNGWGLYDMHGNVWEWCADWYGEYSSGSVTGPRGPASGSSRVVRGGSWDSYAVSCRAAYRVNNDPGNGYSSIGFRLARSSAP